MTRPLQQQVVVITGATSGVGRACVRAFAAHGARIGLIGRNVEALQVAAGEVHRAGGEACMLPTDVADAEAVEDAARQVEERWGRIDTWVNVAMATVFAPVKDMTAEEYRRVTEVTYLGYVYGTLSALRRMLPRDEGVIIQIGSALAYRSIPLQSAYCAAKAAIRGFTDSLRSELIHDGSHVKITMLQLPAVNTPQSLRQRNKMEKQAQPVPPMFRPDVIAEMVVDAAQHPRREQFLGASTLKAVIGQRLVPGFADWYLGKTGYQAQMIDQPNRQQDDMLFHALPGDPGADGPYPDRAHGPDWQMWLQLHQGRVGAAAAAIGSVAAVAVLGASTVVGSNLLRALGLQRKKNPRSGTKPMVNGYQVIRGARQLTWQRGPVPAISKYLASHVFG